MSFAGKWMELEIIMLSEARLSKTTIAGSLLYAESRPKKRKKQKNDNSIKWGRGVAIWKETSGRGKMIQGLHALV
jgi:hypothetical protein